MNKRIYLMLAVLIVAVASISFVSAADTVDIAGVQFNLDDGFSIQEGSGSAFNQSGDLAICSNENGDMVIIGVLENSDNLTLSEIGKFSEYNHTNKTMAGKQGILTDGGNSTYTFIYLEGSKIVMIVSQDQSLIEKTIK